MCPVISQTPASRFGNGIAAILQLVGMLLSALLLGFVVTQGVACDYLHGCLCSSCLYQAAMAISLSSTTDPIPAHHMQSHAPLCAAMTPQAKILMSKVGIMRWVDGKQQLVLRGGNVRGAPAHTAMYVLTTPAVFPIAAFILPDIMCAGVFLAMPELRLCYVHEVTLQGCTYFMVRNLPSLTMRRN